MMAVVEAWEVLVDLVLPTACAGCAAPGTTWCARCRAALEATIPVAVVPHAASPGLPSVTTAGEYADALRDMIIGYKERGRHGLARVLGDRLAISVLAAGGTGPLLLIPVPATAAAVRRRFGDHMVALARRAAVRLNRTGVPAGVAHPLRARRRPDFAGLSVAQRRQAAAAGFSVRPRRLGPMRAALAAGVRPVLVDDVFTTGATLAAAAQTLRRAGVIVSTAAVVAATPRRTG